jgi:L-serine dehydratase
MRAARMFATRLVDTGLLDVVDEVCAELFGSLGRTGVGHGSDGAVLLGLEGNTPESIDPDVVGPRVTEIRREGTLRLAGRRPIRFAEDRHLVLHRRRTLPFHPNGMTFTARDADGAQVAAGTYYSVGGGFVVDDDPRRADPLKPDDTAVSHPFRTAADLLAVCARTGLPISGVVAVNERAWRSDAAVRAGLLEIWAAMADCVRAGCVRTGTLPGGLRVQRRAAALAEQLSSSALTDGGDPLRAMDWVNLAALAVNEENASGHRVVTAPTNGAAGIVPAVLHYYVWFVPGASDDGVARFLLTAGAIGSIYKETASISGAEVGCQGEVGVACSMAAGALCELLGGTPRQVENAAEIAMEHHLGLTCDPIGGLVQIPCIERNAIASVKAINAARMALRGTGEHRVSLDRVITVMRQTGADMKVKYKETARGGLAVNIIEC